MKVQMHKDTPKTAVFAAGIVALAALPISLIAGLLGALAGGIFGLFLNEAGREKNLEIEIKGPFGYIKEARQAHLAEEEQGRQRHLYWHRRYLESKGAATSEDETHKEGGR